MPIGFNLCRNVAVAIFSTTLAACEPMPDKRAEPASGLPSVSPTGLETADQAANRGGDVAVWPAASARAQEIEFVCARTPYLKGQFKLIIVDDLDEMHKKRECKDVSAQLQYDNDKSVLWLVVPVVAKTRRDIEYVYSSPYNIASIEVRSHPIIRLNVLAFGSSDGLCAVGSFERTLHETRFRLSPDGFVGNDAGAALRHAKEAFPIQLRLSDIHEGAKSTFVAYKKKICSELLRNLDFVQRYWVSTPIAAIESMGRRAHSPIPEMESVVRIRICYDRECNRFRYGSGFYINEPSDGNGHSAKSTLVLTNYHVVKRAKHGVVRVSTLMHESAVRFLEQGGAESLFADFFPGTLIFFDERRDLALIRVSNGGPPLKLYAENGIPPGIHEVVALGHPLNNAFYATRGIISRIVVDCKLERAKNSEILNSTPLKCVEHDAAMNPGNSGGPLLFLRRGGDTRVLGVNVEIDGARFLSLGKKEWTIPYPGLSRSIHYEEVRAFLDEFVRYRSSD